MDSELKFMKFSTIRREIFQLVFNQIKENITTIKYKTRQETETPIASCHNTPACRAEVRFRMPLPHDAAEPAEVSCVTFKIQSPSELQLLLLRAASRSHRSYCVVVKNQGFYDARSTSRAQFLHLACHQSSN